MRLDGWLFAVCPARTCMTSVFMTYAAALPVLRTEWGMSGTAAGSISSGFQLGYAFRSSPSRHWPIASVRAASFSGRRGSARSRHSRSASGPGRTRPGFCSTPWSPTQGGTYTTAIRLVADRYPPARRGAAVGWLIASSSAGYTLSLLISGSTLAWGGYEAALLASAGGPVVGVALIWLALRRTPTSFTRRAPACASALRS